MSQAVIGNARIAAAHDGAAELVVELIYQNGATSEIALDHHATSRLFELCSVTEVGELRGKSWVFVREALTDAFNRFT